MHDISSATENRSYDSPPTPSTPTSQAALIQHIKHAAYQAVCIWGQETIMSYGNQKPCILGLEEAR